MEKEKEKETYKGYINYRKTKDPMGAIKTHHFKGKTQEEVDQLEAQFMGTGYKYIGSIKTSEKPTL